MKKESEECSRVKKVENLKQEKEEILRAKNEDYLKEAKEENRMRELVQRRKLLERGEEERV